jgi:putative flippase GtrA
VRKRKQLVVAGLGGVLATLADVVTLMLLVKLVAAPVPFSAFVAATLGAVVGFTFNKYVAFRDRSPITFEQLARFAFVALSTALLMAGAMKLVAVELHVPVLPAKLICAAVVFFAWTYPAQRRLVFRPAAASPASSLV